MTSSKSSYLPKAPALKAITLGVSVSTYELGVEGLVQPVAGYNQ